MKLKNNCVLREGFFIFETVAETQSGHNTTGILPQFLPKPGDADVHGPVRDDDSVRPDPVQKLLPGKDPSGDFGQDAQQCEFGFGL